MQAGFSDTIANIKYFRKYTCLLVGEKLYSMWGHNKALPKEIVFRSGSDRQDAG